MDDLNSWRQRRVGRARILAALWVALVILAPAPVRAAWPERPLSMVVPYPAGGVADSVSRLLAGELGKALGQPVVVENRPGASGRIGLEAVRRAAPDGYTIGLAVPATMVLLPLTEPRSSLAPADFQPISLACETWTALVVDPQLPIRTLPEFLQYGRDQGGSMTYASAGNGTTFHFGAALLARELGIEASHVAYKGEQPALRDVAAGHVQFMLATNSARPLIDAGKLAPIAVAAEARSRRCPGCRRSASSAWPSRLTAGSAMSARAVSIRMCWPLWRPPSRLYWRSRKRGDVWPRWATSPAPPARPPCSMPSNEGGHATSLWCARARFTWTTDARTSAMPVMAGLGTFLLLPKAIIGESK